MSFSVPAHVKTGMSTHLLKNFSVIGLKPASCIDVIPCANASFAVSANLFSSSFIDGAGRLTSVWALSRNTPELMKQQKRN